MVETEVDVDVEVELEVELVEVVKAAGGAEKLIWARPVEIWAVSSLS